MHGQAVAKTLYCQEEAVLSGRTAKQSANNHGSQGVTNLSQAAEADTNPKGRMQEAEEAANQKHGEPDGNLHGLGVASLPDTIRARSLVSEAILAKANPQQNFVAPTQKGPDDAVDENAVALIIALATPTQTEAQFVGTQLSRMDRQGLLLLEKTLEGVQLMQEAILKTAKETPKDERRKAYASDKDEPKRNATTSHIIRFSGAADDADFLQKRIDKNKVLMAEEAAAKKDLLKKPTAKRIQEEIVCLSLQRNVEPDAALEQLAKDQLMEQYKFKLQAWEK